MESFSTASGSVSSRERQTAIAASQPFRDRATDLGQWLALWIERNEAPVVTVLVIAVLAPIARYALRPMWFDEMLTFFIARQGSLSDILRAVPADGNPPLSYLLASACFRLTSNAELAVRLPSMVAIAAAVLALYVFVRRRLGVVIALFAALVFATSKTALYGGEARPYALLLAFTGLTLISWQSAASGGGRRRTFALAGVAVGIAGAVLSHDFGIFYVGVPLVSGEAARLWKRRKPDWPLYLASVAGLTALAVAIPFALGMNRVVLHYVQRSSNFWSRPDAWQLASYLRMIEWWVPLTALAALAVTRRGSGRAPRLPAHETAAATGLALLLVIMLVLTHFGTGYFLPRYGIGSAIGVAVLAASWFALAAGDPKRAAACAALCVPALAAGGVAQFDLSRWTTVNGRLVTGAVRATGMAPLDLEQVAGTEPIVVASARSYMPIWWYSSDKLRARLHYLADTPFAVQQPDFIPELLLTEDKEWFPAKVDNFRQFLSSHWSFLFYCVDGKRLEWTKDRLAAEGWVLTPVYSGKADTLYRVVSLPFRQALRTATSER